MKRNGVLGEARFFLAKIHILGDSHALCFDGAKDVIPHWLGARTAHNLYKQYDKIKSFFEDPFDTYWFYFGEIDCRIHIYRLWKETGTQRHDLIETTIDNYLGAIRMFDDWDIAVMALPPQGYQDNFFSYEHYASHNQRQQLTDVFNFELENECHKSGIRFIDIWEPGYNELPEAVFSWPQECFKDDLCHLKNSIAIKCLEDYLCQK
jgi:hypothetical protein